MKTMAPTASSSTASPMPTTSRTSACASSWDTTSDDPLSLLTAPAGAAGHPERGLCDDLSHRAAGAGAAVSGRDDASRVPPAQRCADRGDQEGLGRRTAG